MLRAEVPAAEAAAVLRALPRPTRQSDARTTRWVIPAGRTLRPTTRPAPNAVCLPGPERLLTLLTVLRHATTVRLYAPNAPADGDGAAAVAWEVQLPGMRLTLMLSQSGSRGFSGEGGVLQDLATGPAAADVERVAELLAWEPRIDIGELSGQTGLPAGRVRAALTALGTSGQIGYDLAEEAYFHRHLPYRASAAETRNPRLRAARALVVAGAVGLDGPLARVGKGDDAHVVRTDEASGRLSCTCFWWAKYRGGRGPCKHVLAVGMVRGTTVDADEGAAADAIEGTSTTVSVGANGAVGMAAVGAVGTSATVGAGANAAASRAPDGAEGAGTAADAGTNPAAGTAADGAAATGATPGTNAAAGAAANTARSETAR